MTRRAELRLGLAAMIFAAIGAVLSGAAGARTIATPVKPDFAVTYNRIIVGSPQVPVLFGTRLFGGPLVNARRRATLQILGMIRMAKVRGVVLSVSPWSWINLTFLSNGEVKNSTYPIAWQWQPDDAQVMYKTFWQPNADLKLTLSVGRTGAVSVGAEQLQQPPPLPPALSPVVGYTGKPVFERMPASSVPVPPVALAFAVALAGLAGRGARRTLRRRSPGNARR